jgi:hypothetical protein
MESETILSPRVLSIVYNPLAGGRRGLPGPRSLGVRLQERMGWSRVDDLVDGYISDIEECSGGLVRYQVVERRVMDAFPPKLDGFRYSAHDYLGVMEGRIRPHDPDTVDYHAIVSEFDLLERVGGGELDEVWLFGFPYAGFYESRMAGRRAFWCNAPPLENTDQCRRRFVMMGFSYERGVGEMLENLGHRAESIMTHVYRERQGEANLWQRFTRYDKVAPGMAEVGSVHFAPNSERDYDWGNPRFVPSRCDDWLHFPDFKGRVRTVNTAEWGGGDIRLHHRWWLSHLPKIPGRTKGILNNWWRYIIGVDNEELGK